MTNYWKHLNDSWRELEERFRRGECKPNQENDVVCYIYHAILPRLEKEGIEPARIKTEYTIHNDYNHVECLVDLNIDDRILVEFKRISRKTTFRKNWEQRRKKYMALAQQLNQALGRVNKSHKRQPVIAIWNRNSPIEGISDDLECKLRELEKDMEELHVKLLFGPRRG